MSRWLLMPALVLTAWAVPVTSPANADGLFLKLDVRRDEWASTPGEDGGSRVRLQRGGKGWEIE